MSPPTPASPSVTKTTRPDHLVLRLMTEKDKEEVSSLFIETFKREPLGANKGVRQSEGDAIAAASVENPVSFVIEDTSLPGPNRLVAFRTSCILTAEKIAAKRKKIEKEGSEDCVQAILDHMLELWFANTTVFKDNPSAKVMKFMALGVSTGYEGFGLAKELLSVAMDNAREIGCDAVMVVASAFATQHLFQNRLGFEEKARVRYTDFVWKNKDGVEERSFEKLEQPEFLIAFEKKL
ncbi:hypothetical protein BX616_004201 [Lobosporangium transversale]|uniref:N-acetyltransferase domain-containing protein n=1 Tax=Lobosporangium transversale TaxID=64571 RepID=A0A1Y2GP64_9FUNG|nr:hypothetical protein BCR41DRAFT_355452 [Lobosporangium transversale]KAF9918929.1 hypothetical protein BX616_004201 [Lobosporangium transversale]ORZ13332.1 hypothetical protein BCR41DRAFT_355452 [Lobosporangium transversale]|eukprot:XP_021880413.1 hypothetical protein BCR41DRAFT_355452 [Lobosporangium transversale]